MENKIGENPVLIVKEILRKFYCERDIEGTLPYLSEQIIWIGPGGNNLVSDYDELKEFFLKNRYVVPFSRITEEEVHVVYQTDCLCMAAGKIVLESNEVRTASVEKTLRFSMLLQLEEVGFRAVHVHVSCPYIYVLGENEDKTEEDNINYEYIQKLLSEKTEVINMINSNIMGGLKGSNDDENFSYFYVNEGLPRMLGFTYDEFMERTGGTAVGAVYPPDLPKALQMVAECFAVGPTYTAEYRMEKKDGTLIWVMDTGRKAPDGNGEIKINSIITDITPMKEASAELELERERYRVALDSITDVLCEYDIEEDLFIQFQKVKLHETTELDRIEMPKFSKTVLERGIIRAEEFDKLIDVLCGRKQEVVEIHTRYIHSNSDWCLSRLRCSVVYNENKKPVKTLGVITDITDEKEKEIRLIHRAERDGLTHLLNQEAVRKEVQKYLTDTFGETEERGAMLVLDLDHFKPVNDKMGHLFGNHILEEVAKILSECGKEGDIVGRIGGDEFLLLLKGRGKSETIETAEEIINKITCMARQEEVETTCSIGIARISKCDREYEQVFKRGDDALYRGKENGGEQWVEIGAKI